MNSSDIHTLLCPLFGEAARSECLAEDTLQDWVFGWLSGAQAEACTQHCERCGTCSDAAYSLLKTWETCAVSTNNRYQRLAAPDAGLARQRHVSKSKHLRGLAWAMSALFAAAVATIVVLKSDNDDVRSKGALSAVHAEAACVEQNEIKVPLLGDEASTCQLHHEIEVTAWAPNGWSMFNLLVCDNQHACQLVSLHNKEEVRYRWRDIGGPGPRFAWIIWSQRPLRLDDIRYQGPPVGASGISAAIELDNPHEKRFLTWLVQGT